jgi:hypothetical protein
LQLPAIPISRAKDLHGPEADDPNSSRARLKKLKKCGKKVAIQNDLFYNWTVLEKWSCPAG